MKTPNLQSLEEIERQRVVKVKVMESIDAALSRYGSSVSELLYHVYERDRGLPRQTIPLHSRFFEMEIVTVFGPGAKHIVRSIIGELETSFFLRTPCETIEEAVKEALKIV